MCSLKNLFSRSILALLMLLAISPVQAQKEGNIWYFGSKAGLDFNSGTPVAVSDGQIQTDEGVAAICSKTGSLIMYTDGIKVWDKTHTVMPNGSGLLGDPSATQSGVIVPQPVRGNRYYLFAVKDDGGSLSYSVIDTNANSGKGDVLSFEKNKILLTGSCEKITAVKHANKVDTWIIAHEWGNNRFVAYLLRSTGLVTTPVVSAVGTPVGPSTSKANVGYSKGCLKLSPDGSKLVNPVVGSQATNVDGFWELYDFDNQTGIISNPMYFTQSNKPSTVAGYDGVYGAEFSPNGRFLYLACRRTSAGVNDRIYQYDLRAGNRTFADINASAVEVAPSSGGGINNSYGTMQIGPDERIYISRWHTSGTSYLSIIRKPNCKGSACDYVSNGINLSSGKYSRWGLPTYISSFFNKPEFEFGDPDPNNYGLCFGDSTEFWVLDTTGVDSVHWLFGDAASGSANFSNAFSPKHVFTRDTTFLVQAVIFRKNTFSSCLMDTVKQFVTIFPNPVVSLGRDTSLCKGESMYFNALQSKATYVWHNASTGPNYTSSKTEMVWVKVTIGGCHTYDTALVTVYDFPTPDLGADTVMCNIDSLVKIPGKAEKYLWDNSSTDTFRVIKNPGTYWVEASNYRCKTRDSVVVGISYVPVFNLGKDSTLCTSDSISLAVYIPTAKLTYLWSNAATDSMIKVKSPGGTYWVRASDSLCSYTDTVKISFVGPKSLNLGPDQKICNGDTARFRATIPGVTNYTWQDNKKDSVYKATAQGKYWVDVFDGYCKLNDTIQLTVVYPIPVNLGNDTTLCTGATLRPLEFVIPNHSYIWNGDPTKTDTTITKTGKYWVDVRDEPDRKCLATDTIYVTFKNPKAFNLGNDTVLCVGQSVNLNASSVAPVISAVWNDALTGLSRGNNPTMVKHKLVINDGICISSDSINISYKPSLNINLGPDVQLCDVATLNKDITDPNATVYEWLDGSGAFLSGSNAYTITNPGGQFVGRVSDGLCSKSDTIVVTYLNTPVVDLGVDQILCDAATFDYDFTTLDADNILWSNGSSAKTLTVSSAGTYWIRASKGSCMDEDSVIFGYTSAPDLDFGFMDTSLCEPTWFSYDFSLPHTTYLWSGGSTTPDNRFNTKGTHWVVATNICGSDSIWVNIDIDEFGCFVVFPNAFSPNENLVNDVFRPIGNVLEFLDMIIYNKWGEKIYEGPAAKGWDGNYNGVPAPQGVYMYTVSYRKVSGGYPRRYTEHGVVHLVR